MWGRARTSRWGAGRDPGNVVFGTIGWLFADLMLALTMAFLVAQTVGLPVLPEPPVAASPPTPSPSPSLTLSPSPTPVAEPVLELTPVSIRLTIDWSGLLAGRDDARADLERQLREVPELAGRRAGLVLTFGGARGGDTSTAIAIAERVNAVLAQLGDAGFAFHGTVYRPFLGLNDPPSIVVIDVYLFRL